MRQVVLDVETTGIDTRDGHRIIELGCVELSNRRLTGNNLHLYFNPERPIDPEAIAVHGITNEFVADKPKWQDHVDQVMRYIGGSELIIHNAAFDVGFLNYELSLLTQKNWRSIADHCEVIDTLAMARQLHPGQRNSLDALCKRYGIDNSHRTYHGALLDAEILATVYLAMTAGQESLFFEEIEPMRLESISGVASQAQDQVTLPSLQVSAQDEQAHQAYLALLQNKSAAQPKWLEQGW